MTEKYQHPMRQAEVHTFERVRSHPDERGGIEWLAMLHPYASYPMFFRGKTQEDVKQQATKFRDDAVERNEAAHIQRMKAIEKAQEVKRKARLRKEAT